MKRNALAMTAWVAAALSLALCSLSTRAEESAAPKPAADAPPAAAMYDMPLPEKVPVPGSELYRLRFPDGTLTANDTCPVAKRPLNPKMPRSGSTGSRSASAERRASGSS